MYKYAIIFPLIFVVFSCKKKGCTDVTATNYSEKAKKDDGSCAFDNSLTLTSAAISNGELLDAFKCETATNNIQNSIPVAWSNVPSGANSLAIIMQHYPNPTDLVNANSYLLLWDISSTVTEIPYGTADDGPWFMGVNKDSIAISYTSPCSPSVGTHEYEIVIYALSSTPANLPTSSSMAVDRGVLLDAISTVTIIETDTLTFLDITL